MALIENDRASFDFELLEKMEAGMELFGFEVKSLRAKQGSLKGARVLVRGGEAYLVGASIPAWQKANAPKNYDPERPRRLLLKKTEILKLAQAESQKGLTVVPLSIYGKGRSLKIAISIARGKKKADKRATIREREEKRSIERTIRSE
jgi:SsrA-binding protein